MQLLPAPAADSASGPTAEPLDPAALLEADFWFGLGGTLLRVALVVAVALVAIALVRRLKNRWVASVRDRPTLDKRRQRVLTVADLLGSVAKYVIWALAIASVLDVIGVPIGPLLAGAGIAGLAIGFGAQTLVKDVISGLFLLFDDTLGVGDLIRFGDVTGTVEYVGLRLIKVRKFDGELVMVPAGELRTFGNKSIGYARAIVDVPVSYEQDLERVLETLDAIATEWASDEEHQALMVGDGPEVQAVMGLADSAAQARIIVQVRPGEQFAIERDLRRMVLRRFDALGYEPPFPRRTVYVRQSADGGTG